MTTISPKIEVTEEAIASFCQRWKVTEFALFGSILRDDFRPDSDSVYTCLLEPGITTFPLSRVAKEG